MTQLIHLMKQQQRVVLQKVQGILVGIGNATRVQVKRVNQLTASVIPCKKLTNIVQNVPCWLAKSICALILDFINCSYRNLHFYPTDYLIPLKTESRTYHVYKANPSLPMNLS
jgi:hypothetical protein